MRSYVLKRFERITRHFEQVIDVHCVLTWKSCGTRPKPR